MGAVASMLYGQVSRIEKASVISRQPDLSINPPMSYLPTYRGEELNARGAPDLGSACLTTEIATIGKFGSQVAGHLQDHLAAIGVEFAPQTNIVTGVDPASDCRGIIVAGDKLLSIDGKNPQSYVLAGKNYGSAGESLPLRFRHPGGPIQKVICRRIPIHLFRTEYRSGMLPTHELLSRTSDRDGHLLLAKGALGLE